MAGLRVQGLKAGYRGDMVIEDLSLEVKEKETLVLMGISGSGKTTLLLSILGILSPDKGEIFLNGRRLNNVPIEERQIGYLPQDYGLFPHLDVFRNVAYGLSVRGESKERLAKRVHKMLELVELQGYEARKIRELSGGQRQRVGLARALAIKPDLLLLDEPLSSIDQVTKLDVATHLKDLFAKLDIPIILVTHNHEDAIFMSERLAVMIDGKIVQSGNTREVLDSPKTPVVRRLLTPFNQ